MTNPAKHRASVHWSSEQLRLGLPEFMQTADPSWLAHQTPGHDEGWTLLCDFERPPASQGNPSEAQVRYLMPNAPHRLARGLRLKLFERATGELADVEILD